MIACAGSKWDWTNPYFCESEECGRQDPDHFYMTSETASVNIKANSPMWKASESSVATVCAASSISEIKGVITNIANLALPPQPLANDSAECCMDSGTGGTDKS